MRGVTMAGAAVLAAGLAGGQPAAESPAGLVLVPGGGQLLRAGTQLPLAAKTGDVLFPGDRLRSAAGALTLLHCGRKETVTLAAQATAEVLPEEVRLRAGAVASRQPLGSSCYLPQMARVLPASQQQYGMSLVRPLPGAGDTREERIAALPADRRDRLRAELAALAGDQPLARVQRAGLFEQYGLKADAAAEYREALRQWPDAAWILTRLFALEDPPPAERVRPAGAGKTYALVIGISKYHNERVPTLLYADRDAELIARFLRSERGGGLTDAEILILLNQEATTAGIRLAFEEFLKTKTTAQDTAIFYVAAHGTVRAADGQAFLVTHDTDPEDLSATALAMADLHRLFRRELTAARRVMVMMDACHAGKLGEIPVKSINDAVENLTEGGAGELFSFLAAGKDETAEEGPQYGGGHGAFTYFVVDGWNGASDRNRDGKVEFPEFVRYVRRMVEDATEGRQNPKDRGDLGRIVLAETENKGLELAKYEPGRQLVAEARPPARSLPADPDVARFRKALAEGKLLPGEPGSAFDLLAALRARLGAEAYLSEENRLRAALDAAGQQVLLRYLAGERVPQQASDFSRGAAWFAAAQKLTPESVLLEARRVFCEGRAAIFGKDYPRAADLLERAARLDPAAAYSYNALGIAYLEQARYPEAALAFQDAVRLAPYWTYPRHNLALTYTQAGHYREAIASYQAAMRLDPGASYLPYNLGLLYQRLGRRRDAERLYRRAAALDPRGGRPENALGSLYASAGRTRQAEERYRAALAKDSGLASARHNLAVLLASQRREAEAVALLRENLAAHPDHVASHLALARTLQQMGRAPEAIAAYAALLAQRPDYVAGLLARAALLRKAGDLDAAERDVRAVLHRQPDHAEAWEQMGDMLAARRQTVEAREAYSKALAFSAGREARSRLQRKLRR